MAAGCCALMSISSERGYRLTTFAWVTPGMFFSCELTLSAETRNSDLPDCWFAISSTSFSLTHSLPPLTLICEVSKRNTDENNRSQISADTSAAANITISTRMAATRARLLPLLQARVEIQHFGTGRHAEHADVLIERLLDHILAVQATCVDETFGA